MVNAFRWMIFVIGLTVVIGSILVTSAGDLVILSINSPSEGEEVYSKMITVFGTAAATEGRYIVSVTVNNSLAGKETWSDDISLYEGRNTIKIVATDNFGNTKTEIRTVDYIAPTPPPTQPPRYDGAPSATPTPKPTVSISITTIPPGAKVRLDDFFKGTTPTLVNVTVGYHKIEVTKEGYHIYSETKKIRLGDGEPQEMIIELKPLTSSIYISSTPSGARVHLDNVDMKAITPCMLKVVVGPHTIKLTKSGYFDEPSEPRNVSVSADGLLSLHETLTRCSYIDISSVPPGAEVHLDGNYKGETPKNISKVPLGNHTINLTKSGYDDEIRTVSVSVAKTYPVYVNLRGYGYINISSDPSGARVYLDGNYTEVTSTNNIISKVVQGNHSIEFKKLGYVPVAKNIQVSTGETEPVHVRLPPTPMGILSRIFNPAGGLPWGTIIIITLAGLVGIIGGGGILGFIKWLRERETKP